jgi:hypothetical protein
MGRSLSKADRLLRNTVLGSLALGGLLSVAQRRGYVPLLSELSHTSAIVTVALASIALIGFTLWAIRTTDEHDRFAHLWSMTWAYMALSMTMLSCWLLEMNGVIAAVNPMYQLFASAVFGCAVWLWMRFR